MPLIGGTFASSTNKKSVTDCAQTSCAGVQMTVGKLRELLLQYPPDMEVMYPVQDIYASHIRPEKIYTSDVSETPMFGVHSMLDYWVGDEKVPSWTKILMIG